MLSALTSLRSASWCRLAVSLTVLLLTSCGGPCQITDDCGSGQVCVAKRCQEVSCAKTVYLKNPDTGDCLPLSGCFLTALQRGWQSCDDSNPCQGRTEADCLTDARCQPAYATSQAIGAMDCRYSLTSLPTAASVVGQDASFHDALLCNAGIARSYAGCRALPVLPESCSALDAEACASRAECQWGPLSTFGTLMACSDRRPIREPGCNSDIGSSVEKELSCLVNPLCQPTGGPCYCPPGAECPCSGGEFVGCEHNDRRPTCTTDADCATGQSCHRGSACPPPHSGLLPDQLPAAPCPGVCAAGPCEALDEADCHSRTDCTEIYEAECSAVIGKYYAKCPLNPAGSAVAGCLCDNVFQRCVTSPVVVDSSAIRSDRSLLILDPEIVADPAFAIDSVLSRFAPPGDEDNFLARWLRSYAQDVSLPNAAKAAIRLQAGDVLAPKNGTSVRSWLSQNWHTTALINRLDLLGPGSCGEVRLTFAYNGGYTDVSTRMTIIVELVVPDDGHGCQQVAQQWAELSAMDDPVARLAALHAIYDPLLKPEHLGQLRTNEFLNPDRSQPWELREWHLVGSQLALATAKQTVDSRFSGSAELLAWAQSNLVALRGGTAEVPERFLAAAVPVDGKVVRLPGSLRDATLQAAEVALNKNGCAGCHLGATGTPFVHIGERLAQTKMQKPWGRAVISSFLREQLPERARILDAVREGGAAGLAMRLAARPRVH